MLSHIKNNKYFFSFLYFFFLICIGIIIYKDYGISIDEGSTRINGFITLKYIFEVFFPHNLENLSKIISVPNIFEWQDQGLGIVFDLPAAFLEYSLGIKDSQDYFLMRHLMNYLFFITAVFFFFLLIIKRFKSLILAFIGSSFLVLSPRIFADSFYNNKDLIFLSFFIINTYCAINFIENPNFKTTIILSITSALTIDTRILGILLFLLIVIFFFIEILRDKSKKNKKIIFLIILLSFTPFFTVLFWPYLWEDPIGNFLYSFKTLSNHDIDIYNFYLGEYILAKNVPWHYTLIWIFITIPLFYLIFFISGFSFMTYRLVKRILKIENNDSYIDLWRGKNELYDLIFFFSFIIPVFMVISLQSTLYDGWRHLYFIYPSLLMISLYGLNLFKIYLFKKKNKYFYSLIILFMLPTLLWMVKNHPHQNTYFNLLAGKNFNNNFEMDYWGISNKNLLEYISKREDEQFSVSAISTTDLNLSKQILSEKLRNKIIISDDPNNSDYIINNYRNWNGGIKPQNLNVPTNFKVYYHIKVDNVPINTVYKKN